MHLSITLRLSIACLQILPVANTNTYTVQIVNGRGGVTGCPTYLGVPACGAGTAPLLQTFTQGATGEQLFLHTGKKQEQKKS